MSKRETYYAPYLSDSDTGYSSDSSEGSDTTTTTTTTSGSERSGSERSGVERSGVERSVQAHALNPPDFRQFASDLQLTQAAAPSFNKEETVYNRKLTGLQMSPFDAPRESLSNLYIQKDPSGTDIEKTIDFTKQNITSIVMLDSRDRDIKVFPQPTNISLRLPRPYKNVTNFQIIQIKLLSSFFYFRINKNNVSITIHEQGRFLPPGATSGPLNAITSFIREGTYNINTLIQELTTQLNRTPIFFDYPGGFSEFAPLFASSGNYSLSFNEPGDNYYDALNNQFIQSPTMTQIVQKYFQTLTAGLASYTLDQIKIAYYYPVLKEILLDLNYTDGLNFSISDTSALLPTETIRSRCIYTFQGINDSIVLQMVDLNVVELDTYRLAHTFRFSLINKYSISYQTNNNRITITSSQLNTSLTNLLNGKYNQYLAEQLLQYGITQAQYNTLSGVNSLLLAILTDMYFYLQKQFAFYFGINFNSYSLSYYTDVNNQIPIQNALNSSGVSSNFDVQVISKNISPQSNNELSTFRIQPNQYWNRLTTLSTTVSGYYNMNSNSTITTLEEFGRPWNSILDRQEITQPFIFDATPFSSNTSLSTARIYQNKLLHYTDIVTDIDAGQYTTFRFKSPVRQTLRVAAFARPPKYRYPAYNSTAYSEEIVQLYDNSYAFIESSQNAKMDVLYATSNLIQLPGFDGSDTYFGSNFNTMYSLWSSNINLNLVTNRTYFTFITPKPPSAPTAKGYTYTLNLSIVNSPLTSNFASPINVYLYHDRAAFMADISDVRNEKPLHYTTTVGFSNTTIGTVSLTAYAQQQYYCMVRSQATTFTPLDFRVVLYYPEGTSYTSLTSTLTGFDPLANPLSNLTNYNYASLADSNFLRLPINLKGKNSNNGSDSNYSVFTDNYVKMGYDTNGVSTDLTNYIGYSGQSNANHINPTAQFRIDPTTGYLFQSLTAYDSNAQQYFGGGSLNQLLTSNAVATYKASTIPTRQTVIAQYYDNTFFYPLPTQPPFSLSSVFTINVSDPNYNFSTNLGALPYANLQTVPGAISSNGDLDTAQIDSLFSSYFTGNPTQTLDTLDPFDLFNIPGYTYITDPFGLKYVSLGNGICGISLIPDDGVWNVDRIMLRSQYSGASNLDPNREIKYLGIYIASYVNSLSTNLIQLSNAYMVMEFSTATIYNSNLSNFGFSVQPGTYYEWIKSKTYTPASNQYLYGYAQQISTMNTNSNSFYTILPFTANGTLTTYTALSGTLVPYFPYYSVASTGTTYLDGSATSDGKGVVYPVTRSNPDLTRGPPSGGYPTQAKYEQSIPITNSVLQYQSQVPLWEGVSSLQQFGPSTFSSNVGQPAFADSLFRVDGHALFNQGGDYAIYEVKPSSTELVYKTTLTADLFGVGLSTPQVMGVSGNESEFAFLTMETKAIPNPTYNLSDPITIVESNAIFGLSNNFSPVGKPGSFEESIVMPLITFLSITDFVLYLEGTFQQQLISTGLTESSNLELYSESNVFGLSFLNYPQTAITLGFEPKIYTSVATYTSTELVSPFMVDGTFYALFLGGGRGSLPLGVPIPADGYLLLYNTIPFTIDFSTDAATAAIFGFDTVIHTSITDAGSGYELILSPLTVPSYITDILIENRPSKNLIIQGTASFSLDFTGDAVTAAVFGFDDTQVYTPTGVGGSFKLTAKNPINTPYASTFTHRFQIDTFNPKEGIIRTRDQLTSSNAFYFPPIPSNYQAVLPNYPAYVFSLANGDFDTQIERNAGDLYSPGTYSATITNVNSFNYTNKGGYSFGYTISYSGLEQIISELGGGGSKSTWPAYEWWVATKASTITDTSTYPYITQPRYIRPEIGGGNGETLLKPSCNYDINSGTTRQQVLDIPYSPFGNFHLLYYTSGDIKGGSLIGTTKYEKRDIILGYNIYNSLQGGTPGSPQIVYTDFSLLTSNQITPNSSAEAFTPSRYYYNFPIIQPWGFNPTEDLSTLSTLIQQPVYPFLTGVSLCDKLDEENYDSNIGVIQRTYGLIGIRGNGYQQELIAGYDFHDMNSNNGVTSYTYAQPTTTRYYDQFFLDYILERSVDTIQSYEGSNLVPYDFKAGAKGGFYITFNEANRIQLYEMYVQTPNNSSYVQSLNTSNKFVINNSEPFELQFDDEVTADFFGFEQGTLYTSAREGEYGDFYISSPNIVSFLSIESISPPVQGSPSVFYKYNIATPVTLTFPDSNITSQLGFQPGTLNSITYGNTPSELTLEYAAVWGNRNNFFDNPTCIKNAHQIFYPTQRIVMTKVQREYDPMTDISGLLYPEWPHTNMFAYNSYSSYIADISANKWGLERSNNFLVSDTNFSGTYYNAACLNIPLLPSSNYNYLAVRGYSPTEKSQVMLRFSLPNEYDFGYARFTDISNEIFMYPSSIGTFNSNYGNLLLAFNSNFVFDSNGRVFGSNIIQGFNGSNFSNVTGFGDFLQQFIEIYNVYNSNVVLLSQINSNIQSNINSFITTELRYILPPNALQRQRYTDPIIYSILWKSALPPQYDTLEDNWGLGWNLGYEKADTPYNTTHVAQSFYKILDDFINLKLNPEYDMNRMDTGAKENLSATLEPTGSLKAYYGKLLLAPFGSYAQTIISNPVSFQLPIPRIEKMTFTWTDNIGVTIDNADCEWNVVIQIVESIEPGKPAQAPRIMPR